MPSAWYTGPEPPGGVPRADRDLVAFATPPPPPPGQAPRIGPVQWSSKRARLRSRRGEARRVRACSRLDRRSQHHQQQPLAVLGGEKICCCCLVLWHIALRTACLALRVLVESSIGVGEVVHEEQHARGFAGERFGGQTLRQRERYTTERERRKVAGAEEMWPDGGCTLNVAAASSSVRWRASALSKNLMSFRVRSRGMPAESICRPG